MKAYSSGRRWEPLIYCILFLFWHFRLHIRSWLIPWSHPALTVHFWPALPFFTSLAGEMLLTTREHFHLLFTSPLPIVIQARLNCGNSYEIIAFAWIYACQSLSPESVNAPFRKLGGFSALSFICCRLGWVLPWGRDCLPLRGIGWINGLTDF